MLLILQPCFLTLQSLSSPISGRINKRPPSSLHAEHQLRVRFSSRLRSPAARVNAQTQTEMNGFEDDDGGIDEKDMEDGVDVSWRGGGFGGRGGEEEKDYDRDPEFADILGSCLDDPDRARSQMEERLRKKRNKILHTKTGSPNPMIVKFNNCVKLICRKDVANELETIEKMNGEKNKDLRPQVGRQSIANSSYGDQNQKLRPQEFHLRPNLRPQVWTPSQNRESYVSGF